MWQPNTISADVTAPARYEGATDASSRQIGSFYLVSKQVLDFVIAALLLLLLLPMFVFIVVVVRLTSRGSAFFVQNRIGLNGRVFKIYKFRSMYSNTPAYAPSPRSALECRITPVGRVLRRASLDELPQLINVLIGHMSLVGPRPEMPFIVQSYSDQERQRLVVKPGITGLWQLSPERAAPIHENLHHDLYYIQHRGFRLDAVILWRTLFLAMRGT
jgi:lipopolysaccharide/colanic/teichoic acid biosynthesis glycosyltransferase